MHGRNHGADALAGSLEQLPGGFGIEHPRSDH